MLYDFSIKILTVYSVIQQHERKKRYSYSYEIYQDCLVLWHAILSPTYLKKKIALPVIV